MSEYATYKNLNKIIDFYGVTEATLKQQGADILSKMLEAAHKDDMDKLHNLGYHIFAPNSVSQVVIKKIKKTVDILSYTRYNEL